MADGMGKKLKDQYPCHLSAIYLVEQFHLYDNLAMALLVELGIL